MNYTDIFVDCGQQDIQNLVQQVFSQNGFTLQWSNPNKGRATKGSKKMNIAFGALSQYYSIDFMILHNPDQSLVVRLQKSNSGWWGGMIGASKVEKQFKSVVDMLSNYFIGMGVFRGRQPP